MLALGEVLGGRYRIGPALGHGGMADVYRAHDLRTDESVALKLLRTTDPATAGWLGREQAALRRLDHPALVRLRATGVHDGAPYLVLDLIEGQPLSEVLRDGPLPVATASELGAYLADGLAHAHAVGVTHRDVKPANILVDNEGRPHLADFGIARLSDVTTATAAGHVIGTAAYLAPEQVRGEPVGPAADTYALGLVVLECLTGERAFPGPFHEAAMARLSHAPSVPETLPAPLRSTLLAATDLHPTRRPTAAALARVLRGQPPATPTLISPVTAVLPAPVGTPTPPARRRRRGAVLAASIGGAIGLVVALAAIRDAGSQPPPTTPPSTTPTSTVVATNLAAPTTVAPDPPTTVTVPATTTTVKDRGKGKGKDEG